MQKQRYLRRADAEATVIDHPTDAVLMIAAAEQYASSGAAAAKQAAETRHRKDRRCVSSDCRVQVGAGG